MFNLREFQTESEYNQEINGMPTPNVVHIISPDTMYYNTVKPPVWYDGLSYSKKFIGLSIYDNTYGHDANQYCEVTFKLIDTSGVEHTGFRMSLNSENSDKRFHISLPYNYGNWVSFTTSSTSTYYINNYFDYDYSTNWYIIKDWNTFWDFLFTQSGKKDQYYNWTPAYGVITEIQKYVSYSHWRLLCLQD